MEKLIKKCSTKFFRLYYQKAAKKEAAYESYQKKEAYGILLCLQESMRLIIFPNVIYSVLILFFLSNDDFQYFQSCSSQQTRFLLDGFVHR